MVGDPDQSIYGWRHADIRNILDFRLDYPDAAEIKLGVNYRSTGNIVAGAGAMIRYNRDRIENPLSAPGEVGEPILGLTCENERGEAAQVMRWLEETAQERQQPWNECAVMYRTHRNGRHFEEECVRQQIPYRVVGGPRFYDRAEIRDCLAYLRLVHNPGDDVALQRIINRPASRCGLALDLTGHHPGRPGRGLRTRHSALRRTESAAGPTLAYGRRGRSQGGNQRGWGRHRR